MPVLDGIGATRRLTAEHPGVAVVVLTTYVDDASIMDALRAGARSFLTKSADRADIARALRAAVRGLGMLDPRAREVLLAAADQGAQDSQGGQGARGAPADPQAQGAPDTPAARTTPAAPGGTPAARNAPGSARPGTAPQPPPDGLTEREAEILALIARGLTNAEIAARLFLSGNTVKTHINRVFAKTGSRDRAAAIVYAHRHHLA
jgi:DNA-binding NarL/FixJ family response regulator